MERKSYLDIVVQVVGSVAVLTSLALLFFVLSALLESNNASEHEFISTESLRAAAPQTLKFVAGIMLTIAIAKFMFGLTSTKDYFGKNFKEIFLGLETSDILTKKGERKLVGELPEEMLEKVHYEIVKRKSNISFPYESSFFKTMSQSIEPLLGKIHYETFKIEIDNTIEEAEDGTRYIISERTIETELHTRTAGNYNLGINSRVLKFVPGFDPEDLYCLNNLLIDGEPGCAVQAAVASGELSSERLASYHKLTSEAQDVAAKTDARLKAVEERKSKNSQRTARKHDRRTGCD